jgi:hypothetical protein
MMMGPRRQRMRIRKKKKKKKRMWMPWMKTMMIGVG